MYQKQLEQLHLTKNSNVKIFVTDKAALKAFIDGSNPVSAPVMKEVMESYSVYELNKVDM